jgi:hypothetical protein
MFKKTAIIAGIGLALSATAQADYNWELGAGYARGKTDTKIRNFDLDQPGRNESNNEDTNIGGVEASYFFETVDTSKGPFKEAAFLDHASRFTLAFADGEVDLASGGNKDGQSYTGDMRYVAEGPGWKLSGVIVDLGWNRKEPGNQRIDTYGLGLGYYLTENTTAVVDYKKIEINNGGDANQWALDLEHFFAMNSGGIKVRGSGGKTVISGLDDPTTWALGGTWYINNNWGIGADFGKTSYDGFDTDEASIDVSWFITESFEVALGYKVRDPDDVNLRDAPRIAALIGEEFTDNINFNQGKLEIEYEEIGITALYRF